MQNFTTSMSAMIAGGALAEPAAQRKIAFIDARDIAAVAVAALTEEGHNGKAYTLTGPELLDRSQVAEKLSRAIGKPVKYVAISDEQFRAAVKAHLSPTYLELMSTLYAGVRAGWFEVHTDTVQQVLGHAPKSLEAFAKEHAAVWR
jgi:uncharacterized protein YbjT (DUF2867 family)